MGDADELCLGGFLLKVVSPAQSVNARLHRLDGISAVLSRVHGLPVHLRVSSDIRHFLLFARPEQIIFKCLHFICFHFGEELAQTTLYFLELQSPLFGGHFVALLFVQRIEGGF